MGAGYTRQSEANIVDEAVINADDFNAEFDQIESAFNATTGHTHDGTEGEGPLLTGVSFANGTITTAKLDDGAVTTAKLDDDAVTAAKLDSNASFSMAGLTLGGTAITATGTELNLLDGATVSTAEINYLDITTLGTSEASKVVTADANGDVTLAAELKATSYNETVGTITSSDLDLETGNVFNDSISANTTYTFSNPPTTGTAYAFTLKVTVSGTRTITWPAEIDWPEGVAPTSPADGETSVFVFYTTNGGADYYGFLAGNAVA